MIQLIAFIIFLIALGGSIFIVTRKIPVLLQLPENGHHGIKKHRLVAKWEKQLKDFYIDFFERQLFLHKTLSKSRVLILKIERRIDALLHSLRRKTQQLHKESKKKR